MANLTLTSYDDVAKDFTAKLMDAADGPGKAPYVDGRELAGIMRQSAQMVSGRILIGTTTDDDGVVIATGDNVQLDIGFTPKVFIVADGNDATPKIYLKMLGMEIVLSKDISLEMVAPALTASSIRFNNIAEDDANFTTIFTGITVDAKYLTFVAIG